jgi:hypothetical protein
MNQQIACSARLRRAAAASALVVALTLAHHAFAQAPVAAGPAAGASAASAPTSVAAQDIRDIRGPKPIKSVWLIPLVALTVLLSGASVYATWTWYRWRQRPRVKTPSEIALDRLERARALMQPELARDFSIDVSSIVREYIESRFRVMAAHLTTAEFLHDSLASSDQVLAAHRELLADFMASCDLAKFGGWNLSNPTMETMWQGARRFVVASAAEPSPSNIARVPSSTLPVTKDLAASVDPRSAAPRETYDSIPST